MSSMAFLGADRTNYILVYDTTCQTVEPILLNALLPSITMGTVFFYLTASRVASEDIFTTLGLCLMFL